MSHTMRSCYVTVLTMLACLVSNSVFAKLEGIDLDGWNTWRVTAIDDMPSWCCFTYKKGIARKKHCDLDGKQHNYGSAEHLFPSEGEVQLYVLMKSGIATKVRTVSPQCPVSSRSVIKDLGFLEARDSARWFEQYITPRSRVSTQALAAISVHDGKTSKAILTRVAFDDTNLDNRKDAIFWMGQVRGREMEKEILTLMFNDKNSHLREYAAFALSQSDALERDNALTKLGNADPEAKVRAKAWFWLAQTQTSISEAAIGKALTKEDSRFVRHQAIFALSQLPETRALDALVNVIENRSLAIEDRKRAMFWLADLGSDEALDYLDSILSAK